MNQTIVKFAETHGIHRFKEPVKFGVPIPVGKIHDAREFTLEDQSQNIVDEFHVTPTATWADGSVKWVLLEFFVTVDAHQEHNYILKYPEKSQGDNTPIKSDLLDASNANPHATFGVSVDLIKGEIRIVDPNSSQIHFRLQCVFVDINSKYRNVEFLRSEYCSSSNSFRKTLLIEAKLSLADHASMNVRFKLHSFKNSEKMKLEVCLHNSQAAKHYGGLWDLGDPGSLLFKEFSVHLQADSLHAVTLKESDRANSIHAEALETISIRQSSSGGVNWQSAIHRNSQNQVEQTTFGYCIEANGELVSSGSRASPVIKIETDVGACLAGIPKFWENFPSALECFDNTLALQFFPMQADSNYELQGGEKKWLSAQLAFPTSPNADDNSVDTFMAIHKPLNARLDPQHWQDSAVVSNFQVSDGKTLLDGLVAKGLTGKDNFFAKRETIDEYGWRNYGEIFADHESLHIDKNEKSPLISHYNNQYDAILGFFIQYVSTSDSRWFELMEDLAKHVSDIDIYDTDQDRTEFNRGLFWHTDHYIDAQTATHRTFSKRQLAADGSLIAAGGGPTAEHCYTTGLMYHYFLTGENNSRDAVLGLAQWMVNSDTPATGFLSAIDSIRKEELRRFKHLFRKEIITSNRQPFTRATGNYITALIDAFEVSGSSLWMARCDSLISRSIHPADAIEKRDFDNIELTWSYVCLLQAISRYLITKEKSGSLDTHYEYAKASLLHYCSWMLENESLYFDNIDRLEFPNATWIAQEIRKCNLMISGARYDQSRRKEYLAKAEIYLAFLEDKLVSNDELELARIQVILLQNYCLANTLRLAAPEPFETANTRIDFGNEPNDTYPKLIVSAVKKMFSGLSQLSIRKEKAWIQARLDSRK